MIKHQNKDIILHYVTYTGGSYFIVLQWNPVKLIAYLRTSADDGWTYAGMQNIDIGLAPLSRLSSHRWERAKNVARPGPAEAGGAWPGRAAF